MGVRSQRLVFCALHGFGHVQAGVRGKAGTFELDGGVADLKFAGEHIADLRQNLFAFFHVHIGNAYVAGERIEVGAERPDVNIVNFLDAFHAQ